MPSSLLSILSAATAPATTQSTTPGLVEFFQSPMFILMVCILIFYVFMMRSKKTQEKQRKGMLDQLKRGDRIQTIGGILGTVVEARDEDVLVKVDESSNTKIRFTRSAIHRVVESPKAETGK